MAKQTSVDAAYGRLDKNNDGGWGRCASIGLFIVLALFLMSLSGDTKKLEGGDNHKATDTQPQTGQASRPTTLTKTPNHYAYTPHHNDAGGTSVYDQTDDDFNNDDDDTDSTGGNTGYGYSGGDGGYQTSNTPYMRGGDTEQDMSDLVDVTIQDIENAGEAEVRKEKGMLMTALSSMGNSLRNGLVGLLGNGADSAEIEEIAVAVEEEVKKNVTTELEMVAEDAEEDEVMDIETNAELEDEEGVEMETIEKEVMEHEGQAIETVKSRIDDRAERIQQNLRYRTAMIEKDMMEKRLSNRLGYQVKLQIVNDEVTGFPPPQQQQPMQGGGQYQQTYPQQQSQQQQYFPGQAQQVPYYPGQQGQQPQNQQGGSAGGVPYQQPAGGAGGVPYQQPGQYQPPIQYQPPQQQQQQPYQQPQDNKYPRYSPGGGRN